MVENILILIELLTGKYKTQLYDENIKDYLPSSPGIGMHVEVKDPNQKVVLSKYYSSEGRFTFTSHTPGEHLICLHSNSTRWSLWAGGKLVSFLSWQSSSSSSSSSSSTSSSSSSSSSNRPDQFWSGFVPVDEDGEMHPIRDMTIFTPFCLFDQLGSSSFSIPVFLILSSTWFFSGLPQLSSPSLAFHLEAQCLS